MPSLLHFHMEPYIVFVPLGFGLYLGHMQGLKWQLAHFLCVGKPA